MKTGQDAESLKAIESLITDEGEQMSGLIQDCLQDVESYYFENFCKLVKFIEALGWYEHTGDWDLQILFTMKDGTEVWTYNGYSDIRMENGFFIVEGPDKLDDDEKEKHYTSHFTPGMWKVPIAEVKSLSLLR